MDYTPYIIVIGSFVAATAISFALLVFGYLLGKREADREFEKRLQSLPPSWAFSHGEPKPGGMFAQTATQTDNKAYVVNRPTAKDIKKWNEDPKIKAEKAAIADSLKEEFKK